MPDAPAVPAAPAAPAAPAEPQITFGGEVPASPAPAAPAVGGGEGGEGGGAERTPGGESDRIAIDFGDGDKFTEEGEQPAAREDGYDSSKPFNPKIEELLKSDPEALRAAKQAHYENRDFRKLAKSPKALSEHMDRVNRMGGLDAIEREAGEWATAWAGFQAGDPQVLEEWFAGNAEGMSKLMPVALDKFYQTDRPGWDRYMAGVVVNTLMLNDVSGQNFMSSLGRLYDLVQDNPEAKKILDALGARINGLEQAAKRPAGSAPDKKFDQRAKELEQRDRALYIKELNTETKPLADRAAKQALDVLLRGRKVDADTRRDITADVLQSTYDLMKADAQYQKDAADLLNARENARFIKLYKAKLAKMLPIAARKVVRKYTGLSGNREQIAGEARSRVESPGGSGSGAARVKYTGKFVQGGPDPTVVDWARMRAEKGGREGASEMFSDRQFYVKGKKELYYF